MEYSVHLQNFPNLDFISIKSDVVRNMDKVREICNCVLALRKEENIRVRMQLKKITIYLESNPKIDMQTPNRFI